MTVHFVNQYGNSKAVPLMFLDMTTGGTMWFFCAVTLIGLAWYVQCDCIFVLQPANFPTTGYTSSCPRLQSAPSSRSTICSHFLGISSEEKAPSLPRITLTWLWSRRRRRCRWSMSTKCQIRGRSCRMKAWHITWILELGNVTCITRLCIHIFTNLCFVVDNIHVDSPRSECRRHPTRAFHLEVFKLRSKIESGSMLFNTSPS